MLLCGQLLADGVALDAGLARANDVAREVALEAAACAERLDFVAAHIGTGTFPRVAWGGASVTAGILDRRGGESKHTFVIIWAWFYDANM